MNFVSNDFKDALRAMQIGDPPLRWAINNEQHAHTLRAWASRAGVYRTFTHGGQLWVVRVE